MLQIWYTVADVVEAWDLLVSVVYDVGRCNVPGRSDSDDESRSTTSDRHTIDGKIYKINSKKSLNKKTDPVSGDGQNEFQSPVGTDHGIPKTSQHRGMNHISYGQQNVQTFVDAESQDREVNNLRKREVDTTNEDPKEEENVPFLEEDEKGIDTGSLRAKSRNSDLEENMQRFMPDMQELRMFGESSDGNWVLRRPSEGTRVSKPVTCQATFLHDLVDITRQMLQVPNI